MALPPRITFPRPPASLRSRAVRSAVLGVPSRPAEVEAEVPAFSPLSVESAPLWRWYPRGGVGLWSDLARTVPATPGTGVAARDDYSDNAAHATQATAAARPTLVWYEGDLALRYDGGDFLNLGDWSSLTAGEIFVRRRIDVDPPPAAATAGIWRIGTSVSDDTVVPSSGGFLNDGFGSTVRQNTVDPAQSLTAWHIYSVYSTPNDWSNFLDGTLQANKTTNTVAFNAAAKFGSNGSGIYFMLGHESELVMFAGKLSAEDRAAMIAYMQAPTLVEAGTYDGGTFGPLAAYSPIFPAYGFREQRQTLAVRELFAGSGALAGKQVDIGTQTWAATQGAYTLSSSRATATADAVSHIIATIDYAANFDATVTVLTAAGVLARNDWGLVFNLVDASNYWLIRARPGPVQIPQGTLELIKAGGGTLGVRKSVPFHKAASTSYDMRVRVSGDSVFVSVGGAEMINVRVPGRAYKTATRMGLYTFRPTSGSPDAGTGFDQLDVCAL